MNEAMREKLMGGLSDLARYAEQLRIERNEIKEKWDYYQDFVKSHGYDSITELSTAASHYEQQIQSLLALVALKDEALLMVANRPNGMWYGIDDAVLAASKLQPDSCRLVEVKWEARAQMDGSYFPGAFVPITKEQFDSAEWEGMERRVLYTIETIKDSGEIT